MKSRVSASGPSLTAEGGGGSPGGFGPKEAVVVGEGPGGRPASAWSSQGPVPEVQVPTVL